MLVDLSITIMQVTVSLVVMQDRSFCGTYACNSFCSKYVGYNFYCNYEDGSLCLQLCRWYFLQCIMRMTVSIVIMQVTFLYSYVGDRFK